MKNIANIALITSLVLFLIFVFNVYLGASNTNKFLSEINEVNVLIASVIAFVVGILTKASDEKKQSDMS